MDKELNKMTLFSMLWNSVKLIVALVFTLLTLGKFVVTRESAIQKETYVKWRMESYDEQEDDDSPKSGFFD